MYQRWDSSRERYWFSLWTSWGLLQWTLGNSLRWHIWRRRCDSDMPSTRVPRRRYVHPVHSYIMFSWVYEWRYLIYQQLATCSLDSWAWISKYIYLTMSLDSWSVNFRVHVEYLCLFDCILLSLRSWCVSFLVCGCVSHHAGAIALSRAYFGRGTGPIFLDDTQCLPENHTSLAECFESADAATVGEHNCDHSEDVSVICPGMQCKTNPT